MLGRECCHFLRYKSVLLRCLLSPCNTTEDPLTLTNRLHYVCGKGICSHLSGMIQALIKDKAPNTKKFTWPGGYIQPGSVRDWQSSPATAAADWEGWFRPTANWGSWMKSSSCSPVSESHKSALVTDLGLLHSSEAGAKPCLWIYGAHSHALNPFPLHATWKVPGFCSCWPQRAALSCSSRNF